MAKKKEETIYVGSQIPVSVHTLLNQIAVKDDKSLSAVIRTALCEYVSKTPNSKKMRYKIR